MNELGILSNKTILEIFPPFEKDEHSPCYL